MIITSALDLANKGFYVFPLRQGQKKPVIEDFATYATRDETTIKEWWGRNPYFNIGIYCGKFNGDGEALIGVDVDNKGEKKGSETLFQLELNGFEFPQTFTQTTPTGGEHLIYKTKHGVMNGVNKLGPGLDIRSVGGYLVGAGSIIDSIAYTYKFDFEVAEATEQLVSQLRKAKEKKEIEVIDLKDIDQKRACDKATEYLKTAPVAVQGDGGDLTTFKVICAVKDMGVSPQNVLMILPNWNDRCQPPWSATDLTEKIRNAYQYGQEPAGSKNPEVLFDKIIEDEKKDPVTKLNDNYAFITIGSKALILWERENDTTFLNMDAFHYKLKPHTVMYNDKIHQVSNLWMSHKERRTYDDICFDPSNKNTPEKYNLWRGFTVEAKPAVNEKAKLAVNNFLSHIHENVCEGSEEHFNWVMSFFAHMIQKPYEKPSVALVLRGRKGVGKNVLVETIGKFLGPHFNLASNARYLLSNFNSHLERCLLFVLDEAFWSGNKSAEGTLKDIITGTNHNIERKGHESYIVKNLTRVCILGNEDWLVPATHDERRFAVFNVGDKRRNDIEFFEGIRIGMEDGGYEALFKYLLAFDLSKATLRTPPSTSALHDQKLSSLGVFAEWLHESLKAGRFLMSDFAEGWEAEVEKNRFREAYRRYSKDKGVTSRIESEDTIGRMVKKYIPEVEFGRLSGGTRPYTYILGTLEDARAQWDKSIGHTTNWE